MCGIFVVLVEQQTAVVPSADIVDDEYVFRDIRYRAFPGKTQFIVIDNQPVVVLS